MERHDESNGRHSGKFTSQISHKLTQVGAEGSDDASWIKPWGIEFGRVRLIKHTVATGGIIVVDDKPAHRLTPIQYDLLNILVQQVRLDVDKHEAIRGFVSSYELLCSLPWDTAHPDLTNLKQLIRRVRRRITPLGIAMQSRCGLGYRLAFAEPRRSQP